LRVTCDNDAPLVKVNICLFADNICVSSTNTLDLCQSVHDLALAVYVRVKQTQDMLLYDQRRLCRVRNNYAPEIDYEGRGRQMT